MRIASACSCSWATSGAACRAVASTHEALDLLGDDDADPVGLAGAQRQATLGPVAQVVEVEQRDAAAAR